jgi:hypothetical protein
MKQADHDTLAKVLAFMENRDRQWSECRPRYQNSEPGWGSDICCPECQGWENEGHLPGCPYEALRNSLREMVDRPVDPE